MLTSMSSFNEVCLLMYSTFDFILAFIISFTVAVLVTPLVIKFAKKFGFVDAPNYRKVHSIPMPRIGGLAIVAGATAGLSYVYELIFDLWPIVLGGVAILIIGILDDKYTLSPKIKLIGQLVAACIVVFFGFDIDFITIPFVSEKIALGPFSYIIAILWIIGITNAINLIDGLDGLASGVSVIALASIMYLAILNGQYLVVALTAILIGSTLGFLIFNFHPAKIFLGDTGSLFLGYCISTISMLGLFKSVTVFSLVIPIIILAIPIFDTLFAIIRRVINKKKIFAPDKSHLHHRFMALGFSHRETVLIIYAIGIFFGLCAIIFSHSTLWGAFIIMSILIVSIQILAEVIGLISRKPFLNIYKRIRSQK